MNILLAVSNSGVFRLAGERVIDAASEYIFCVVVTALMSSHGTARSTLHEVNRKLMLFIVDVSGNSI